MSTHYDTSGYIYRPLLACHSCAATTRTPIPDGWGLDFCGRWCCDQCRWPLLMEPVPQQRRWSAWCLVGWCRRGWGLLLRLWRYR